MRFGPDDKLWVVTDPTPASTIGDILFEASLRDLDRQFKGGLTMEDHPTLFTDRDEAEREAGMRMLALRASQAIVRAATDADLAGATRIRIEGADGAILLESDLANLSR